MIEGTNELRSMIGQREILLKKLAKELEEAQLTTEKAESKAFAKYDLTRFFIVLIAVGFFGVTLALWLADAFRQFSSKYYLVIAGYGILIALLIWDLVVLKKQKKEYDSAKLDNDIKHGDLAKLKKELEDLEDHIPSLIIDVIVKNDSRYTQESLEAELEKETVQDKIVFYDDWARVKCGEVLEKESSEERYQRAARKIDESINREKE